MVTLDAFWSLVCDYDRHLWFVVMFMIFLFLLTLVSLAFGQPGTLSYWVAILNLVLIATLGSLAGAMFWYCARHRSDY